ncbi:MAG: FHA domain-containing protein [Myxococcales bacterium]|nr:FHA domain-containing protein [Myxococcales bacterium]MDD9971552.1 FHA domain-containing protein [Myxococcales bacterium]
MFLLVDVRHAPASLMSGLDAISDLGSLPPPAGADDLVSTVVAEDEADVATAATEVINYGAIRRTAAQIARRLANQERFVLPLAKRVDNAVTNKITVGRTANNDIMLKHGSISKFHATFEEADRLLLRDADSKNGTSVNGESLARATEVQSGDIVLFGSVEVMLCNAESLWQVLNERAAA